MKSWVRPALFALAASLALPASAQVRIDDPDDPFAVRRAPSRRAPVTRKAPSGWLGVELTNEMRPIKGPPKSKPPTAKGPPSTTGPTGRVQLKTVFPGSGAAAAGLQVGDVHPRPTTS